MILPPDLLKAYETFKKEPNISHLKDFPHLLQFFYRFPNLPWIIIWEYKIEKHPQYPFSMLTREFKLKWWNKSNFDHICQELQKKTSSSQTENSNFLLEKSQVQCQLASVSDSRQLKSNCLKLHHKYQMMKMTQQWNPPLQTTGLTQKHSEILKTFMTYDR